MRSKIADKILSKAPEDLQIFTTWYLDIVVRINQLLEKKKISQKKLAELLDKKPSEISKWLNGEHNFTLRSIAKLQAELGEPLLYMVVEKRFENCENFSTSMTVVKSKPVKKNIEYQTWQPIKINKKEPVANAS